MSAALRRLDEEQLPGGIKGVAREMFETLAPEMSGLKRVALSNLWLFGRWCAASWKSPSTNAMLRTTTALTIVRAGNKDNVMPGRPRRQSTSASCRATPSTASRQHVRKALANDDIEIKRYPGNSEPSPVSPTDSTGYRAIQQHVRRPVPDAVVAPA
jgi:carboxypeptidase PM20D1